MHFNASSCQRLGSKLLAISDMKAIPVTEIAEILSSIEKKDSNALLAAPPTKRIKVEQMEMEVRIEESQAVWVTFSSTRIQLCTEDKLVIEDRCELSNKHINLICTSKSKSTIPL